MCFSDVQLVKYHQQATIHVDGGEEIQICAVNAGRTVGGAAWQLVRGVANVFYAVGLNLKKETVLDGADISVFPPSPSLLITDSDVPISASSTRYRNIPLLQCIKLYYLKELRLCVFYYYNPGKRKNLRVDRRLWSLQ